jgi:hypothetical protein
MEREELLNLSKDELSDKVLEIEEKYKKSKESADCWHGMYFEMKEKFDRYKDVVKSVVLFID